MMHDFIGQAFEVGSWVATSGKGNTAAEYGMILGRVEKLNEDKDKLTIRRLTISYPDYKRETCVVGHRAVSTKPNKWVVVHPPADVVWLFEKAVAGNLKQGDEDSQFIGKWLHGSRSVPPSGGAS